MRILYLCHRVPWPPSKGEKLRSWNQIRLLARNHDVDLMALGDSRDEAEAASEALAAHCERVEIQPCSRVLGLARCALASLGSEPFSLSYFRSRRLARRVASLARTRSYDLVFASTAAMAPYARLVEAPRIIDLMDADSEKWLGLSELVPAPKRWVYAMEGRRMKAFEAGLAKDFDRLVVVNDRERERLDSRSRELTQVVSNGVALRAENDMGPEAPVVEKTSQPSIVFVGTMSYQPSVDAVCYFAHDVLPRLREKYPDLTFTIVGRSPKPEVLKLGKLPGVHVTGTVPSVESYLRRAWIFVAPHRVAPGLQNKILEAIQMGLPVVCSEACFRGLAEGRFESGRDLISASAPDDYVAAITELVENPALRDSMAVSAAERLGATYCWERVGAELEAMLASVDDQRQGGFELPRAS